MILLQLLKDSRNDGLTEELAAVLNLVLIAKELNGAHLRAVKYY
jgi:hypothetical protein